MKNYNYLLHALNKIIVCEFQYHFIQYLKIPTLSLKIIYSSLLLLLQYKIQTLRRIKDLKVLNKN